MESPCFHTALLSKVKKKSVHSTIFLETQPRIYGFCHYKPWIPYSDLICKILWPNIIPSLNV